jgi:hypothetical protein
MGVLSPETSENHRNGCTVPGNLRALKAVADADEALARGILDSKPELRRLERAVLDLDSSTGDTDARPRFARGPLERALAESLRRAYSLVRRLVRVGTGLLRADMDHPNATGDEAANHAD